MSGRKLDIDSVEEFISVLKRVNPDQRGLYLKSSEIKELFTNYYEEVSFLQPYQMERAGNILKASITGKIPEGTVITLYGLTVNVIN